MTLDYKDTGAKAWFCLTPT